MKYSFNCKYSSLELLWWSVMPLDSYDESHNAKLSTSSTRTRGKLTRSTKLPISKFLSKALVNLVQCPKSQNKKEYWKVLKYFILCDSVKCKLMDRGALSKPIKPGSCALSILNCSKYSFCFYTQQNQITVHCVHVLKCVFGGATWAGMN